MEGVSITSLFRLASFKLAFELSPSPAADVRGNKPVEAGSVVFLKTTMVSNSKLLISLGIYVLSCFREALQRLPPKLRRTHAKDGNKILGRRDKLLRTGQEEEKQAGYMPSLLCAPSTYSNSLGLSPTTAHKHDPAQALACHGHVPSAVNGQIFKGNGQAFRQRQYLFRGLSQAACGEVRNSLPFRASHTTQIPVPGHCRLLQ